MPPTDHSDLETRLGVKFKNKELLRQALRHSSSTASPGNSYERMEFLGDSIVGMVVCDLLYRRYRIQPEGVLSKLKAFLVSEPILAEAASQLGMDQWIEMSEAEVLSGGRARRSILSDAFEALVGAIFLDQGYRSARAFVRRTVGKQVEFARREAAKRDYKSQLQERLQALGGELPAYRLALEWGPPHSKMFRFEVLWRGNALGSGEGKTKKEAQQAAAKVALLSLDQEFQTSKWC